MAQQDEQIRTLKRQQDLDFFANIPTEVMIDIFSRLPIIPTIMRCKRVCKSWLGLLESFEFAESHVSKSVAAPGPALDEGRPLIVARFRDEKISKPFKILELVDSQDSRNRCNVVFKFNFPHPKLVIHSSADGLLLLVNKDEYFPRDVFICNPVTREYMKLSPPRKVTSIVHKGFGFGVSKLTGKYKVVRLTRVNRFSWSWPKHLPKCEVYTLGTGSWRRIAAVVPLLFINRSIGVFLNGNLHWLVQGQEHGGYAQRVACFDLETECFSTFSRPIGHIGGTDSLCALRHSLCLSVDGIHVVDIWFMNKYGDGSSWRKEFVIKKDFFNRSLEYIGAPIKIFENGDILFADELCPLFCYSSKTKAIREVDVIEPFADLCFKPSIYVPSFLPLKTFTMEKVSKF